VLEARDISNVQINPFAVYLREHPDPAVEKRRRHSAASVSSPRTSARPRRKEAFAAARKVFFSVFRTPKPQLDYGLREAMRQETEMVFATSSRRTGASSNDPIGDYTFLNEDLAKALRHRGCHGKEMRKVTLRRTVRVAAKTISVSCRIGFPQPIVQLRLGCGTR